MKTIEQKYDSLDMLISNEIDRLVSSAVAGDITKDDIVKKYLNYVRQDYIRSKMIELMKDNGSTDAFIADAMATIDSDATLHGMTDMYSQFTPDQTGAFLKAAQAATRKQFLGDNA